MRSNYKNYLVNDNHINEQLLKNAKKKLNSKIFINLESITKNSNNFNKNIKLYKNKILENKFNLYRVLSVRKKSNIEKIKKNYLYLKDLLSEDGEKSNSEVSQIIEASYKILNDENIRKEYDIGLEFGEKKGIFRLYNLNLLPDNIIIYNKEWNNFSNKLKKNSNTLKKLTIK
jgi:DnaJ-class molecular chaperone